MAVLLDIQNACKRYGEQVLLDDASATITDDGRVGFIGRNGAGKSTLLRIILGEEELDSGKIVRHPRLRLGYLRQHDPFEPGESALDFLMRDSGQPDWKCGEVAGDFELKGPLLTGPVKELSGGWQTRVKLAALLLHEPNLLLLDEPTNFLDLRTQILLEHFLRGYREACLVVSHDRAFLRATCDQTLDLAHGKLTLHPGPVDEYLVHQQERRLTAERTNAAVLAKKRELEDFIARNRARASTASRAKSKAKQLEKLELEEIPLDAPTAAIRCPEISPRRGAAVRCRELAIGYPDRTVASSVAVEIVHGARAAIVGDNGQGKTTFLRTLVGSLNPLAGDVKWGHGCEIGTYAQHVYTSLDEKRTVLEQLEYAAAPGTKQQRIIDLAAAMLFRQSALDKPIRVLSGGERARLCLAGLLLGSANVLVLDEPGNHLDVETVEALAAALADYAGTVIFTSHDRAFMQAVATTVIEVKDGRVVDHLGNYGTYVAKVTGEIDAAEAAAGRGRPAGRSGERASPGKRGMQPAGGGQAEGSAAAGSRPSAEDDRAARKEVARLEKSIARLDAEKKERQAALLETTDPAAAVELHTALTEVEGKLAAAEERWLELQEQLAG
ncbi:MAG: ABC-F family ATP-binding cassette domain-containing protein [Planctomycetota bacterium]|nr:ABC-F family ATP-binding cassette domain-containing protein [Planctomycetota bacterium]